MTTDPDDERRQSDDPTFADVMNGFSFDSRQDYDGYEEQYPDYEAPERRFWTRSAPVRVSRPRIRPPRRRDRRGTKAVRRSSTRPTG